jgi:FkbM family methyltransferase
MAHPATERLLAELSTTATLVDVGARDGPVFLWAEFGDKARIICFEPDREECERLNRAENKNIIYVPCALADHDRGIRLHFVEDDPAASSIYPLIPGFPSYGASRPVRMITCPSITLDQYCAQHGIANVDAIKLDTQGSELDILRGGIGSLKTVSFIDIEVEFGEIYEGQPLFCDVDRFLRDHGFVLWRLNALAHFSPGLVSSSNGGIFIASSPGSHQLHDQDNGQLLWGQAQYVRREFPPTAPDAKLDREQALKAAILVGQFAYWDLSLEILRKSGDPKLYEALGTIITPCGPLVPLRDQLMAARAEIAELQQQIREIRGS